MSNDKRSLLRPSVGTVAMIVALVALFTALATQATPCANAAQCNVGDTETFTNDTTFEAEINVGATPGPGALGQVIVSRGASTAPEWAGIGINKSADETVNSTTTLQDDDHLTAAVEADSFYKVEGVLLVTSGTTPDWKFQFSLPASAEIDGLYYLPSESPSAWAVFTEASATTVQTTGGIDVIAIHATLRTDSTAGDLTLQWAQGTSDGGNTQVQDGSWLTVFRLE